MAREISRRVKSDERSATALLEQETTPRGERDRNKCCPQMRVRHRGMKDIIVNKYTWMLIVFLQALS